jgi:outer membrane biogenesis lipoprotein LolB
MNVCQKSGFFLLAVILVMTAACSSATKTPATMAGFWQDNDNNVTTIQAQNSGYVAVTTYDVFQSRSQNSLVSSSYENGVLTWKYCPPAKSCITMKTVSFKGDTLDVTWINDNGESGKMTLTRTDKGSPF